MKKDLALIGLVVSGLSLLLATCFDFRSSVWGTFKNPETERMLKRFIAAKTSQANAATNTLPSEFRTLLKYAQRGNWLAMSNAMQELQGRIEVFYGYGSRHPHGFRLVVEEFIVEAVEKTGGHWAPRPPPRLEGTPGEALGEVYGALEAFVVGEEQYSTTYGREIIAAVPPGSIFWGGADPTKNIVTAMCRSQMEGDPFFTLAQNELRQTGYRQYLHEMYGKEIYIVTNNDADKCHDDFMAEISRRPPNAHETPYPYFDPNGMLLKVMFEKNPEREFFIDEGFQMDWAYPHLEPHGLIFKLNREAAPALADEIVQRDREYWTKLIQPMIGDWLNEQTSTAEIKAFVEKTYGLRNFNGFKGDPRYIQNAYSQRLFSRSRAAIAGLYQWRAEHAPGVAEKERLLREADFAYRQAWAISPDSPEAVYRYVNFLLGQARVPESVAVAELADRIATQRGASNASIAELVKQLKAYVPPR